jgi:hypothetical protein
MENNHFCKGIIINTELQVIDLVICTLVNKFRKNKVKLWNRLKKNFMC